MYFSGKDTTDFFTGAAVALGVTTYCIYRYGYNHGVKKGLDMSKSILNKNVAISMDKNGFEIYHDGQDVIATNPTNIFNRFRYKAGIYSGKNIVTHQNGKIKNLI